MKATTEPHQHPSSHHVAQMPALWHEPAPDQFDLGVAWWFKALCVAALAGAAILWFDLPVARWVIKSRPIPDLAYAAGGGGDIGRELMWLEQWGQWTCSVLVILGVALIDRHAGPRRALAIALGCLSTVLVTYLLKDLFGRSRPYVQGDGSWIWGGPAMGFGHGSKWGSFPSAHTTGAFALSAGLSWFYPRGRALFMGLATITAGQRVLHAAHYISDVIAGMGIAVLMARWSLGAKLAGRMIALMPPRLRAWFLK